MIFLKLYGYYENKCREEVVSKEELETYYVKHKCIYKSIKGDTTIVGIGVLNGEDYRITCNTDGVLNLTITAPILYDSLSVYSSRVCIKTGSIAPTVSIQLGTIETNGAGGNVITNSGLTDTYLMPIGVALPQSLNINSMYTIDFYFDGLKTCYKWSVYQYA